MTPYYYDSEGWSMRQYHLEDEESNFNGAYGLGAPTVEGAWAKPKALLGVTADECMVLMSSSRYSIPASLVPPLEDNFYPEDQSWVSRLIATHGFSAGALDGGNSIALTVHDRNLVSAVRHTSVYYLHPFQGVCNNYLVLDGE